MWFAPRKGKSVETEHVMFTFALTGRGVIGCGGLPRVSLRLPWAEEAIGLSARMVNSAIRQSHAARILSHAERNTSVQIGEICGSNLSAQCA